MSKPTYEYLEAQVKQLEADNEKAMSVLKEANDAVLLAKSKFEALAAENAAIKTMNDCLSEELRGYESDGDFDGPHMHLLWWKCETPNHDAFLAEVRASALDEFAIAQDEQAKKYYELSPGCSGQNECQFAAGQAWYFAECIRKGAAQ
ncbi:TPA: hypothetical protein OPR05_003611 [Citrobacter koseri]|nr:hypothetical protein [Citrobacter koseri]